MKRIIILAFKDGDVEEGLRRLIQINPDAVVVIPVTDASATYLHSAMKAIQSTKAKYHLYFTNDSDQDIGDYVLEAHDITLCGSPIKEVLREVTTQDILAMVWDDSIEAHMALHAVEDFAIETWSIEDGLDVIEVDYDEDSDTDLLYEEMQEKLTEFIEAFADYLTAGVLDVLAKTIQERIEQEAGQHDISPFDEK